MGGVTVCRRLLLPALLLVAGQTGLADEAADRIRAQEKAFSKSVMWVKMTLTAEDGEQGAAVCSGPAFSHGGRAVVVVADVPMEAAAIRIGLADGQEVEAELLGRDEDLGLMFVAAKQAEEAKAIPALAPGKGKALALGDAFLLIDRRAQGAPEETTCRLARVVCALTSPKQAYFYSGMSPEQTGGLAVTPDGEVVGMVGLFKSRDADGEEESSVALLPIEQILDALSAVGAKP